MALVLADRVRDTTTTTGTGTVTLSGTAPTGYQTFGAAIGNGNTTYYTINAGSQWEVGLGTYSSTGPSLARTTVLASSNGGSLVDFSTGTKDVFVTYPAEEAVYQDGSAIKAGTAILGVTNGGTGTNTTFTAGSVVFAGASGVYTQDNANLFWDNSNDRLGISTTSPGSKLDVVAQDAIRATGFQPFLTLRDSSDSNKGSRIQTASAITIFYNDTTGGGTYTERMRIDSSGNVGIGTSSPTGKLDVNGKVVLTGGEDNQLQWTNNGQTWRANNSTTGRWYLLDATGSKYPFQVNAGTLNDTLCLTSTGVGVGTSSPGKKLEVVGQFRVSNSAASGYALFEYGTSATASNNWHVGSEGDGTFRWYSGNLGAGTERMRITSAGLVGIGTSAPNHTLDVAGNVGISSNIYMGQGFNNGNSIEIGYGRTGSNFAYIDLIGDTTYSDYGFRILRGNGGANTDSRLQHRGTGALTLLTEEAAPITFNTSATERARITSAGYLLVGTTAPLSGNTSNEFKTTTAGSWPLTINSNDRGILHRQSSGTTGFYEYFEYNGGTNNGSISYSGGTTAYNTTSDYRLKKIDGPITNSGAYIDALNPVQGIWKADGTRFVGLVAHEVQEVSSTPVVTGEKDGEMMQQMDYSSPEIIANLIAEVQSLRARVAQLEGN